MLTALVWMAVAVLLGAAMAELGRSHLPHDF
jgi:hypothetical protein